ncbi:MAG: hypothetical protein KDK40_04330, partial [Chlamydiia bacterium]|nr:hypothetical protein [Chlamydiia bacterium]
EALIVEFATSVEEQYGIAGVVDEVLLSKPYWILRYLHYFGDREEGDEIASPHIDKGGLTLHLYESDDGLQAYSFVQRRWKGIPIEEKQTVIISAAQLQLQSKGLLKALTHRVIATEKTARTGRFSMVCFVPFQNLPMYNKEVYGSMQIHDTGFNYDLSHSDFKRFFCHN